MHITGQTLHDWMRDLYPICRSLTGEGVRSTLRYFQRIAPGLVLHEVPTGTGCFDWTVPDEWNITEAYLLGPDGETVVDFRDHNLHVVGYSTPVDAELTLDELQPHLHSREDLPDAIPYVTSYYKPYWGFCLPHARRAALRPGVYRAVIRSTLAPGSLTYGELLLPGREEREILITSYVCHPSLCNNELSGPVLAMGLAAWLAQRDDRRFSYRFYLGPETIGAICYISRNLERLRRLCAFGVLLSNCGDDGPFSMVQSKRGDALPDRLARHLLARHTPRHKVHSFLDRASDEQQFNSPGVDLPFISLQRTRYGEDRQYHTSLDNLDHVTPKALGDSFAFLQRFIEAAEANHRYRATKTCVPQLGKRGLYPNLSDIRSGDNVETMLDFLAYADGTMDLVDIAETIGADFFELSRLADTFLAHALLERVEPEDRP